MNWKLGLLMVAMAVGSIYGCYDIYKEHKRIEAAFIEEMRTKTEFSGEDVDRLWRFKNENGVSKEYMDLYNKKIKHLPGERYW